MGGRKGERLFWGDMGMDEGISAMASEGTERRGRDERKEKREENWRQAFPPNGASYRAAQLHCHCIALATLLEERCGRALPSMVLRGSSHSLQNLPSRQAIVTRRPKRLIMDDGGECKHAHL